MTIPTEGEQQYLFTHAEDANYLFYQSVNLSASDAQAEVQFRAHAVKADTTSVTGEVCTVTIAK